MAHIFHQKKKLLARINRILGQLRSVAEAVEDGRDCSVVLQNLAACRGALNGLMSEVIADHIRSHLQNEKNEDASLELIEVLKSYLK